VKVEVAGQDEDGDDHEESPGDDAQVGSRSACPGNPAPEWGDTPGRRDTVDGRHQQPPDDVEDDPEAAEEAEDEEGEPDQVGVHLQVCAQPGGDPGHPPVIAEAVEAAG
jgi:hypothetical protein